ncbi:MAG: signal peptidase II, partial [Flavobacteriales bacterium]
MSKRILFVVLGVLLIDQILKVYIKLNFSLGEHIPLIDGLIELHFIENKGMAFGMEL